LSADAVSELLAEFASGLPQQTGKKRKLANEDTPTVTQIGAANNGARFGRLKGSREKRISKAVSRPVSTAASRKACSDGAVVLPKMPREKSCTLCRVPGHQRQNCPQLKKWKKLPITGESERQDLVRALHSPGRFCVEIIEDDDSREVMDRSPPANEFRGIVFHRMVQHRAGREPVVECTLLGLRGEEHSLFTNVLFKTVTAASLVTRSKTFIVINEIEEAFHSQSSNLGFACHSIPGATHLSQMPSLSQFSQLSQQSWTSNGSHFAPV
jgi:hypothetical protein